MSVSEQSQAANIQEEDDEVGSFVHSDHALALRPSKESFAIPIDTRLPFFYGSKALES